MKILSLFILYFAFLSSSMADDPSFKCVVISGKGAESESGSTSVLNDNDLMLRRGSKIGNNKCKSFGSWKEAHKFIMNLKMDQRAQVLIYQGAHGSPGGVAELDKGEESAEKILEYLENISSNGSKVALFNVSCYSGDLLKKKLLSDFANGKANPNLCIVTDSQFSQPSYTRIGASYNRLVRAKSGDNIEDIFKMMNGGLISSASWSQVNADKILSNGEFVSSIKDFENLTTNIQFCPNPNLKNLSQEYFKGNDKNTLKMFSSLANLSTIKIPVSELKNKFSKLKLKTSRISECLKKFQNEIDSKFSSETDLLSLISLLNNKSIAIPTCQEGIQSIEYGDLYKDVEEVILKDSSLVTSYFRLVISDEDTVNYISEVTENAAVIGQISSLSNSIHNTNSYNLSYNNDLTVALKSFFEYHPPDEKLKVIENGFSDGQDSFRNGGNPLQGFIQGSLANPNFQNVLDQNRRKACREFKLP